MLYLPTLLSLTPKELKANEESIPTRVILIQMRDGTFETEYWPTKVDPTLVLDQANEVYGTRLSNINGPISNIIGTEWDTLRNKFSIVRGLGYLHYAFHKACAPFSGSEPTSGENGPPQVGSSIDCILENSPRFIQNPLPTLPLRISPYRTFSWWRPKGGNDANVIKMPRLWGNKSVFDSAFPNAQNSQPANGGKKLLVMDKVREEFNRLLNNRRLGADDHRILQMHSEHVHDLQKRITASEKVCTVPNLRNAANKKIEFENYFDTIATAFACDTTRISTIHFTSYDDNGRIGSDTHHANSHAASDDLVGRENSRLWQGWIFDRIAYLMKALDRIPQSDGKTLLDHTIIVVANEDGCGSRHSSEGLQLLIGGGAVGKLRMGYFIDYRKRPLTRPAGNFTPEVGLPWPSALISIMKAAGLDERDFAHQGRTPGLFGDSRYQFPSKYRNVDWYRRNPLPFLYNG